MSAPTESYLKVHYELRPAKQVERRMLIDAFQLLGLAGFPIRDYQYTGMGSIYFVDFALVHRLLGINRMLSVEYSSKVKKRVEFNKPFSWVETRIAPIGDVISTLSADLKHILWLDYDGLIQKSHLQDVTTATTYLSVGSLLLVTVDAEAPNGNKPSEWIEHYRSEGTEYFDSRLTEKDFARSLLPRRNIELIKAAIQSGLAGRSEVKFLPIFSFVYRDGHTMLTVGGMIGTSTEQMRINASGLFQTGYCRASLDEAPCEIEVPRLTRKERQLLDSKMPCSDNWLPTEFELTPEHLEAYKQIYRYCPTYAELLL